MSERAPQGYLVRYDAQSRAIAQLLAEARTSEELLGVRNLAEGMRANARIAGDVEIEVNCAELRMLAERRLGQQMAEAKAKGLFKAGRPENGSNEEPFSGPIRLEDIGVDKKLSSRAQNYAALSDAEWEARREQWRADVSRVGARVTTNLLREERKAKAREEFRARIEDGCNVDDLAALVDGRKTFGAILADPPWRFETFSDKGKDRAPDQHYVTDPLRVMAEMPVAKLAAKDCVLFLWAIGPMLREALDLIDAWGFDLKTIAFTWMKQNRDGEGLFIGNGYWTRANAELCLLATRGAPMRLDMGVPQALLAPVMEHSRKPDEVHERIMRLVGGPYLELYARRPRDGWTTWGNEIPRGDFEAMAEAIEADRPIEASPLQRESSGRFVPVDEGRREKVLSMRAAGARILDISVALKISASTAHKIITRAAAATAAASTTADDPLS